MNIGYIEFRYKYSINPYEGTSPYVRNDGPRTIMELAKLHPEANFHFVGRAPAVNPVSIGFSDNVTNHCFEDKNELDRQESVTTEVLMNMDAIVVLIVVCRRTHQSIPSRNGEGYTTPLIMPSKMAYIVRALNQYQDKHKGNGNVVYVSNDPRSLLRARDIKWPPKRPILSMFNFSEQQLFYRYNDPFPPRHYGYEPPDTIKQDNHWLSTIRYSYANIEMMGMPFVPIDHIHELSRPIRYAVIMNQKENDNRAGVVMNWVLPFGGQVFGDWSRGARSLLEMHIEPIPQNNYFAKMREIKYTLAAPASKKGWPTAKALEAFSTGTICFFHPSYDVQEQIIGRTKDQDINLLYRYLRVQSPRELNNRMKELDSNEELYRKLIGIQRRLYDEAYSRRTYLRVLEYALRLKD